MQNAFRTPGQLSEMNRQRNRRQPPAADDPQPMASGIPLRILIASGTIGRSFATSIPLYVSNTRLSSTRPHRSASLPVAVIENSSAGSASNSR